MGIWIDSKGIDESSTNKDINYKIKRRFQKYRERYLSLSGKILVINSCILPIFYYCAQSYILYNNFIKNLNNLIRSFLWNGKINQISLNKLYPTKCKGGLGLVNSNSMAIALHWNSLFKNKNRFNIIDSLKEVYRLENPNKTTKTDLVLTDIRDMKSVKKSPKILKYLNLILKLCNLNIHNGIYYISNMIVSNL